MAEPSENLYLQGLPLEMTDDQLTSIMGQYGQIVQCKVLSVVPGKETKVALLRMASLQQASWIVDNLNGNIPLGLATPVNVSFSINKARREVEARKAAGIPPPAPRLQPAPSYPPQAQGQPWPQPAQSPPLAQAQPWPQPAQSPPLAQAQPWPQPAQSPSLAQAQPWPQPAQSPSLAQPWPQPAQSPPLAQAQSWPMPPPPPPAMLAAPPAALGPQALPPPLPQGAALTPAGELQENVMMKGTVKRWDSQKGFGFVVPEGGGPDVFVHVRELGEGEVLVNGAQVLFEAVLDPAKGPGRYRVNKLNGAVKKEQAAVMASDRLFIKGLPLDISEETISAIFGQYGTVVSLKKLPGHAGRIDTAALVRMGDANQAKWLVDNVNANIPAGLATPVHITYAESKNYPSGGPGAAPVASSGYGIAPGGLPQATTSPY